MKRFLYLIILLSTPFVLQAQNTIKIANDPAIVSGRLSNGLTFYIVKDSQKDKGFADFYMVQKCGTSVESESEEGMTDFLVGMNLFETRGFPDGSLFEMLSGQGTVPDRSLVRHVGQKEVILGLKDIPTGSSSTVTDEALTVLINMCSGAELTHDICRSYGFDLNDVREFQKKWFRPDMQAVVITGDIDVNSVRDKIQLLFMNLPKSTRSVSDTAAKAVWPGPGSVIYGTGTDKGTDVAVLSVSLMYKPTSAQQRNTAIPLVQDYIHSIMCDILASRIRNGSGLLPFPVSADVRMGLLCDASGAGVIRISLRTVPDHLYDAAGFLSGILDDMKKGVSETEFNSSSLRYLNFTDRLIKRFAPVDAGYYAAGCFRHFLEGYPLPSTDEKKLYASKLRKTFSREKMNDYIESFLNSDSYRTVHAVSPSLISEEELEQACAGTHAGYASLLKDVTRPLLPGPDQSAAKLKAPVTEPVTGALCYTLPNYAKVYFKQNNTESGRVSFLAVSRGGLSLADKSYGAIRRYINGIAPLSMPESPCPSEVELKREFTPDRIYLKGSCTSDELETLFRMAKAGFTSCSIDEKEFSKRMEALTSAEVFGYDVPERRAGELTSGFLKEKDDYSALDAATASHFISKCFSNIGSFTILISGDCTPDRIKDMTERYLCSIPGKRTQLMPVPGVFSFDASGADHEVSMEMDSPVSLYSMRLDGSWQYGLAGMMKARVITSLVRQTLSEAMFKEGLIVRTWDEFYRYPSEKMSVGVRFESEEAMPYYRRMLDAALEQLSTDGVSDQKIEMTKKYVLNSILRSEAAENQYWIDVMEARFNGKNFLAGREDAMAAMTPAEVNQSLKDFIKKALPVRATITPDVLEVPELPQIEYMEPFPEPLDLTFTMPESENQENNAGAEGTEGTEEDPLPGNEVNEDPVEEGGDVSQTGLSGISDK